MLLTINYKCLTECIVHKIEVKPISIKYAYFGYCKGPLNGRFMNHKALFLWKLQTKALVRLSWTVERKASPCKCGTRRCDLYRSEKFILIRLITNSLLGKWTELYDKCRPIRQMGEYQRQAKLKGTKVFMIKFSFFRKVCII